MKVFLSLILLTGLMISASAQSNKLKEESVKIKNLILNDEDAGFDATAVPDKWKNESAVILYQKYVYTAQKSGRNDFIWHGWIHRRIKLNDKAAIDKFSQLGFVCSLNDKDFYGIKITKADGRVIEVDTKDAIVSQVAEIDENVLIESALMYDEDNASAAKIAVPALELGDILDIYCYNVNKVSAAYFMSSDIPGLWLNADYPICSQNIVYNICKEASHNFKSVNGAPDLEKTNPGTDAFNVTDINYITYSLNDTMREPFNEDPFQIYNRIYPQIKTHIGSERLGTYKYYLSSHIFCHQESGTDYNANEEDIKAFLVKYDIGGIDKTVLGHYQSVMRKRCDECSDIEKAKLLYYSAKRSNMYRYDSPTSVLKLSKYLGYYKIDHQILAIIPKNTGSIENLINPYELIVAIRIENGDDDLLFFPPMLHRNINEYNYQIDDADAYVYYPKACYKLNKAYKTKPVEKTHLPKSDPSDNTLHTVMTVSFDQDKELMNVNSESRLSGYHKRRMIDAVLYGYDFEPEEERMLGKKKSEALINYDSESEEAKQERLAERIKTRNEYLQEQLKEEYEVDTLTEVEVLNSGCFEDPELRYSQVFTIKNMFNKAGRNIMFDLGKLIGSQISLDEKEMTRETDIYYPFPCIFSYDITVTLPDGFMAENLDAFNVSLDNSCMSLKSEATDIGNAIRFTFRKEYKNGFDTKDKWSQYVEVLDAAYKITQQKLVLKPR